MKTIHINLINGFLGTVIIHLIIGIIFFYAKITSLYNTTAQIKVETPETIKQEQSEQEKKISSQEKLDKMVDAFLASQNRRNIGVNVADKSPLSSEKDLQQVEKDIEDAMKQISQIQENLDKQSAPNQPNKDEGALVVKKRTEKIQGKLAVYKGPTNIYFDLENRKQVNLYVPVYKCEGHGQVVVFIVVNKFGEVESASIDKSNSDNDDCLIDAAYDAALRSRFNSDPDKAPSKQKGSITYLFVAQ